MCNVGISAGAGAKMKLVVNMIMGSMLTAYSEGMALAEAADLELDDVMDVVNNGGVGERARAKHKSEIDGDRQQKE